MKNNHPDALQRLLAETIEDSAFQRHALEARNLALREFRRARLWRQVRALSAIAALLAAAAGVLLHLRNPSAEKPALPIRTLVNRLQPDERVPQVAPDARPLTDAELLASFPPNSCYLAEVDGRKMLVFYDQALGHTLVH